MSQLTRVQTPSTSRVLCVAWRHTMDTLRISARGALLLALGLLVWTSTGCRHGQAKSPAKSTSPISETQAPPAKTVSRPTEDPAEKRLQGQINSMQEQIGLLTAQIGRASCRERV